MKNILIGLCVIGLVGCDDSSSVETIEANVNTSLRSLIDTQELTVASSSDWDVPDISSPQAQLGMDLFFSKTLGGDQDSACVTCHHPSLGGGDNLSLPIGVESDVPDLLGAGRTNTEALDNPEGGPPVPRNAPTTFNLIAWDQFQFHDGRVESLDPQPGLNGSVGGIRTPDSELGVADPLAGDNLIHAQARFPVTSPEEMKGFNHETYTNQTIRELLAGRLGGSGDEGDLLSDPSHWLSKFQVAFAKLEGTAEELITEQNVSKSIAEYERSQAFFDTPWKSYVEGNDSAISDDAKEGAILFYTSTEQGGADCASCHSGDFFTDEKFHNLAMPQIGPGKGDGVDGSEDFGRARETGLDEDKFAFRTPALINVEVTGPWSHAGAYTSLEAVIKHHLNAANAIDNFDSSSLLPADIHNLDKMVENTQVALNASSFEVETLDFSDLQVGYLVAFLEALTDPCVKDRECLADWIPDGDVSIDPNGDQLNAIDQNGNLL